MLVHHLHFVQYSNFENLILFSSCSVQNFMRFNHGMVIMNITLKIPFIYICISLLNHDCTEHKLYNAVVNSLFYSLFLLVFIYYLSILNRN